MLCIVCQEASGDVNSIGCLCSHKQHYLCRTCFVGWANSTASSSLRKRSTCSNSYSYSYSYSNSCSRNSGKEHIDTNSTANSYDDYLATEDNDSEKSWLVQCIGDGVKGSMRCVGVLDLTHFVATTNNEDKTMSLGTSNGTDGPTTTLKETVVSLQEKITIAAKFDREELLDSLDIRCPRQSCRAILDPSPDACAVITCINCALVFCGCCHGTFANSGAAHLHIPMAHKWHDVFLPSYMIQEGQKRIRLVQLLNILEAIDSDEIACGMLHAAATELKDLGLPLDLRELQSIGLSAREQLAAERMITVAENQPAGGNADTRPSRNMPVDQEDNAVERIEVTRGRRILELSFEHNFVDLNLLLEDYKSHGLAWEVDWGTRNRDNNTVFNTIVRLGNHHTRLAAMRLFISLGIENHINDPDNEGWSALSRCALLKDYGMVSFLLDQEFINVDWKEKTNGRNALMLVAEIGDLQMARMLLHAGADIYAVDYGGLTVLSITSLKFGSGAITEETINSHLKFWLERGAPIQVPDSESCWTVLHRAASGEYMGTCSVPLLLEYGADVTALTNAGKTPLKLAVEFGNVSAIPPLVVAEGSNPSIPFGTTDIYTQMGGVRREQVLATLRECQQNYLNDRDER